MKIVIGLVFCVFMGITAISLGVGAAWPPINNIAKPLVCPDGEMKYQRNISTPLPDTTYIEASYTCVDPSGTVAPISKFLLSLVAGTFYGVALFALLAITGRLRRKNAAPPPGEESR
jgi:hypothetical protein